jgi:hypothetical protein
VTGSERREAVFKVVESENKPGKLGSMTCSRAQGRARAAGKVVAGREQSLTNVISVRAAFSSAFKTITFCVLVVLNLRRTENCTTRCRHRNFVRIATRRWGISTKWVATAAAHRCSTRVSWTTARGAAKGYGAAPPRWRRRTETAREALVRRGFSSLKKAAPRELHDDATPLP